MLDQTLSLINPQQARSRRKVELMLQTAMPLLEAGAMPVVMSRGQLRKNREAKQRWLSQAIAELDADEHDTLFKAAGIIRKLRPMRGMRKRSSASERIDPVVWKVAVVAVIGPLMTQVDSTVVNVSLSTISQALGASIATAQWLVSGYLLAMAPMLPLNGWRVDRTNDDCSGNDSRSGKPVR
jgi:hypothetical protein